MMKLLKKNVIVSFAVFLTAVSIGGAIFGWFLFAESQSDQNDTSALPWSVSPQSGYTYIEAAVQDNHFIATKADGSKVCINGEGQTIEACMDGHQFTNGLREISREDDSGLKTASGKVITDGNIYYFEDCGEYLITFSDADGQMKQAALYDSKGNALIDEKSYCHLDYLGNDWFFAECDSNYVYNARTGEKHFLNDEILLIYPDGKGGFYGETGPNVEVYPLDQNFQLQKDGISFSDMAELSEGLRYVQMNQPDKPAEDIYAYVNADNEVVINLRDADGAIATMASPFSEGKAFVQKGSKLVCINKSGEHLFELDVTSKDYAIEETEFHEGYAALSLDDDSFDLFDSKKDYGYVDVNGTFVIEPKLYAAKEVRGGYAIAAAGDEAFGILKFDQEVE